MAIRVHKPTTPGRRKSSVSTYKEITKSKPEKSLVRTKKNRAGRNRQGRITVHHQGGGHKRKIRIIDYKRNKYDAPATVEAIEYDPNRSARIALIKYEDNTKAYMIAVDGLKVGRKIERSKKKIDIKPGNRLPLKYIPAGILISGIEFQPGLGGQLVNSAGSSASVMGVEGAYAKIKLPSGEIRNFPKNCLATIGQVSNISHRSVRLGKAGRMRWMGVRPTVRGKAKNPVDHPHGGGEGSQPIGLIHPKTRTGKPALGVRTRNKKKKSNIYIVKRRKTGKKKRR